MRLNPATIMGKEESKKIKTIIQSILDKPESYDFQNPVDWKCNDPSLSSRPHRLHLHH